MSKSSRLGRPALPGGTQNCSLRKDLQGNRSCMLRIGERLMRAGSEGNLVQRPLPAQNQNASKSSGLGHNGAKVDTLEDKTSDSTRKPCNDGNAAAAIVPASSAEHPLSKKQHMNNNLGESPHSAGTFPRSYASSSRDGDLENLLMQHSKVEKKKEVFLDHLRQKYPHHAAIILGHQERMREQLRNPRPSEGATCDRENMSDGESLNMTVPFSRGCKARSSLPIGRSSSHAREPVGVLYLQYGDETKQIRMPAEINSEDTLRALFVAAFPQQLSMQKLQSPNMAIYIKDTRRNVYFDLEDIRNITSHSCLKVYHKDASHVFNRHTRPTNADGRISKDMLYGNHSPVHRLSSSSRGTLQGLQGSMSPPMVRSMPSSPSRMAYSGRSSQALVGMMDGGSTTLPRDRLSGTGRSSSLGTSSSAILERRDVKPDEDVSSCKSMALVLHGEGGQRYADAYSSSLQEGGRNSFASSQCSGTLSHPGEMLDSGPVGIPGGVKQYRASVKPLMGYGDVMEQHTQSLHRQKNRKCGDSQLPQLGTPPPSPQRLNEVRLNEGQIIGGVGLVSPERMAPIRRSLRWENNVDTIHRNRGSGSSSSTSSVFVDSPLGQSERLIQGHMSAFEAQSERMKAMEEQIASLAGLVHHALSVGGDLSKGLVSESAGKSHPVLPEPSVTSGVTDMTDCELQQCLAHVKNNVSELRQQLNQLRNLQLSHQQTMSSMLHMASQELVLLMCDRLTQSEERTCGRRAELEEERIHYLATEEQILKQLSELEEYVNRLQSGPVSLPGQLPITLRDVEEGAVNLRRVGETLAVLKGEFPELQVKMRSVLRLEVDAVRFLKEEPHKMDCMLKRVKALTEALSSLRRCVSESTPPSRGAQAECPKASESDREPPTSRSPPASPKPQPRSLGKSAQAVPSTSLTLPELNRSASASPAMARRGNMASAAGIQAHQHSPPLNPTHGKDLPTVAKVSPRSREGSPALQKPLAPLHSNELHRSSVPEMTQESHTTEQVKTSLKDIVLNTDQEPTGGRLSQESQPSTCQTSIATQNLDLVLQEAQATLMKSIPDLNLHSTSKTEKAKPLNKLHAAMTSQDQKAARQNDEVLSCQLKPSASLATGEAEAQASASPSASPSVKRMEKPRRSSMEKKQSPDSSGQSPPPVPRRMHASSIGQIPGKAGEVVNTPRKESLGQQGVSDKPPSVLPQTKPLRHPPEVKPKPKTSVVSENKDDEEDDKNRSLKEMQVAIEASCSDKLPVGQQTQKQILPISHAKAPPVEFSNNHSLAAVNDKSGEPRQDTGAPDQKEDGNVVHERPIPELNSVALQNVDICDNVKDSSFSLRLNQEILYSPTTDENKLLTITALQKDNNQSIGVVKPDQIDKAVAKQTPNEKPFCLELQLSGDKECLDEEGSLSPDILDDGGPPPPPLPSSKIAHQISKIRVKLRSANEDLDKTAECQAYENLAFQDGDDCDSRPVVILNESVDFDSDCKRLSTIFEYDEDLERTVPLDGVAEENKEETLDKDVKNTGVRIHISENLEHTDAPLDENQDSAKEDLLKKAETNRPFKFKFPKSKLLAISKALRSKTAKKTLDDGIATENQKDMDNLTKQGSDLKSEVEERTDDAVGSLDESIRQLQISADVQKTQDGADLSSATKLPGSPSKRPASHIHKNLNSPQSKRVKAQLPTNTVKSSPKKQASGSSTQRTYTRLRRSSGSPEKTGKVQQQASQKQPSQADSRGSKAAGDCIHLRASKIPALRHSCGKAPSSSSSQCSDAADSLQTFFSSSSSSSSASSPTASGKNLVLCPPPSGASRLSPPSKPALFCPREHRTSSPSPSSSPHKSLIPSLNLSRLLPSSGRVSSASPVSGDGGGKRRQQRRLTLATATAAISQLTSYSSSSYSSSSSSASVSPTSSSSSPQSPSSSFLHPAASHGGRTARSSEPGTPSDGKKFSATGASQ
ncbi:sickle tail protein homolog [Corythoichthys intestinalis]|uniref:sickle tail protein homolog n=1 Tax=Corythoichthys intestinalis TaxID=161448 RepID=UPI0025A65915|nr:sickle tail protein homolog [Corythoichthys intestinalis]